MEAIRKRPHPTAPIMKRRFGKLSDEGKRSISLAAEQFKEAARRLRECKSEDGCEELNTLIGPLHQPRVEITKYQSATENNPLWLFTLDAISLWELFHASAPYLGDLYRGLTAEPAWGMPVNLDRDDIRARPLIALHEFIEELTLTVEKLVPNEAKVVKVTEATV